MTQMVILAGGLGTRLGKLTKNIPKSMVLVDGKHFLHYQISLIKKYGIKDIVLCVGHLSEKIEKYFGDGNAYGVKITYSKEEKELGTAGAIKNARKYLEKNFFVMYGDSYLPINYLYVQSSFENKNKLGLNVVFANNDKFDKSNVSIKDGFIQKYDKENNSKNMHYIDYGLSIFDKNVLDFIPDGKYDLGDLFNDLINKKQLLAFETKERFYEIGSLKGLSEFENFIKRTSST